MALLFPRIWLLIFEIRCQA